MNAVLTGPWEGFLAWAALITAIASGVTVLVRIIGVFSRSFSDLMATLEDDNVKLRDALSSAEQSRTELANQLVLVQQKIAETVQSNTELVTRLQNELSDYRATNLKLLAEIQELKQQIAQCHSSLDATRSFRQMTHLHSLQ